MVSIGTFKNSEIGFGNQTVRLVAEPNAASWGSATQTIIMVAEPDDLIQFGQLIKFWNRVRQPNGVRLVAETNPASWGSATETIILVAEPDERIQLGQLGEKMGPSGSATKRKVGLLNPTCEWINLKIIVEWIEWITESLSSYPPVDPDPTWAEEGSLRSSRRLRVKSTIDLLKNGVAGVVDVAPPRALPFKDRSHLIDPSSIDLLTEESSLQNPNK